MDREEAIKVASEMYGWLKTDREKEALETLIPELKESEDERIRQGLIRLMTVAGVEAYLVSSTGIKKETYLAYLEKQNPSFRQIHDSAIWDNGLRTGVELDLNQLEKQKEEAGYEEIPVESTPEYKLGFKAGKESEKQKEQKPSPKFKVGDRIVSTRNPRLTYEILEVGHVNEHGNIEYKAEIFTDGKPDEPHNIHYMECCKVDKWGKLIEQEPDFIVPKSIRPKFAVGDTVCRPMWSDHTIREIYIDCNDPVYVCVNDEGLESHISFSEQDEWKRKEQKQEWSEEDEKVRRWILEYFYLHRNELRGASVSDMDILAWLEKQKPVYIGIEGYGGTADVYSDGSISYKQKQKSAWSEEDEKMRNLIAAIFEANYPDGFFKANELGTADMRGVHTEEIISWLKSLRPQPKEEWNEEDKEIIANAAKQLYSYADSYHNASNYTREKEVRKVAYELKSLSPSWKPSEVCYGAKGDPDPAGVWIPSEEQMNALNKFLCDGEFSYIGQATKLQELYIELEKYKHGYQGQE